MLTSRPRSPSPPIITIPKRNGTSHSTTNPHLRAKIANLRIRTKLKYRRHRVDGTVDFKSPSALHIHRCLLGQKVVQQQDKLRKQRSDLIRERMQKRAYEKMDESYYGDDEEDPTERPMTASKWSSAYSFESEVMSLHLGSKQYIGGETGTEHDKNSAKRILVSQWFGNVDNESEHHPSLSTREVEPYSSCLEER